VRIVHAARIGRSCRSHRDTTRSQERDAQRILRRTIAKSLFSFELVIVFSLDDDQDAHVDRFDR
jgi:hypothetical protein